MQDYISSVKPHKLHTFPKRAHSAVFHICKA